jgi:hypothetical protein
MADLVSNRESEQAYVCSEVGKPVLIENYEALSGN